MTPDEWFAAVDPDPLLGVVYPQPPLLEYYEIPVMRVGGPAQAPRPRLVGVPRRVRLFATACARMVWHLLPTDPRSAVLISERYADGRASDADLAAATVRLNFGPVTAAQHAMNAAGNAAHDGFPGNPANPQAAARSAAYALATQTAGRAPASRAAAPLWHALWTETYAAARETQTYLLRDIFPPPGYSPRLDPGWLTGTVVAIARQIDATGDFSAVPILADALEEAGCNAEPVLQCCRAPGTVHARGNWVVDLALDRL